jgi:hypothetical protein
VSLGASSTFWAAGSLTTSALLTSSLTATFSSLVASVSSLTSFRASVGVFLKSFPCLLYILFQL